MNDQRVELGVMRLTIIGGGGQEARAARIAQLTSGRLLELMEHEMQSLGADLSLAQLDVPPVHLALDTMDDEAVARAGAEAIYRALLASI
ncbi:MAG TPA: hypothetical protein VFV58_26960 [Blastocatellia bacterium]|jgi:hypothetical protein|nr:hypothetical protein [Blastocatellia bacterium]